MNFMEKINRSDGNLKEKVAFDMVTNGYLLFPRVVDYMAAYGLDSVHVTIDGDKRTHNERLPHKTDADSYTMIMNNLAYAIDKIRVAVRVNVDRNNYDFDVVSFLKEWGCSEGHKNLHVYVGKPESEPTQKFSPLSEGKFSECYLKNYQKAVEKGANKFSIYNLQMELKDLFCSADSSVDFVFLPDGRITNCWNYLSSPDKLENHIIGVIKDGNIDIFYGALAHWLEETDLANLPDKCFACSLLPICLGGCPHLSAEGVFQCCYPKFNLRHYIESMVQLNKLK